MKKSAFNFSIVIPTLNEERYIPKLLGDLANQTTPNFEVIVVDAKSDDNTRGVVNTFSKKLKKVRCVASEVRNVSHQRNLGANLAQSDWIVFMDADNRLPKYFLEGLLYKIKVNKLDVFTCQTDVWGKSKRDEAIVRIINLITDLALAIKLPGAQGALIGIRRKAFKSSGGFDESLHYAEDWEFIKNVYRKGGVFKVLRDPKYYYSLRRFKRDTNIKNLGRYTLLVLKVLTGSRVKPQDYPMGGRIDKRPHPLFLKLLRQKLGSISQKQKFVKSFQVALNKLKKYS